jgi:hypothetical protein
MHMQLQLVEKMSLSPLFDVAKYCLLTSLHDSTHQNPSAIDSKNDTLSTSLCMRPRPQVLSYELERRKKMLILTCILIDNMHTCTEEMVKIGINGFGRIGRLSFRGAWDMKELEIVRFLLV